MTPDSASRYPQQPGGPHLYEVAIRHSGIAGHMGIDVEAKFPDYVFPSGATVRLYWDTSQDGDAVQWVQAGEWRTPWNDGSPDLEALCLAHAGLPASAVRLSAIAQLHERYLRAEEVMMHRLRVEYEKVVVHLSVDAANAFEVFPAMTDKEEGDLLREPGWWPEGQEDRSRDFGGTS